MKIDRKNWFEVLKARGLTSAQQRVIEAELNDERVHSLPGGIGEPTPDDFPLPLYAHYDLPLLQGMVAMKSGNAATMHSLDELLQRDKQREKDGFPRKINIGRLVKPGRGGREKVVVVPTTVEEKFIHDTSFPSQAEGEGEPSGGTGDEQEGEVIGEQPVRDPDAAGGGPGEGEGGEHELESNAYELGRILTEQFELPNLKDKGKQRSLTRYSYDLTDKHRGFGQVLDKKATLRKIVETNINLGNITGNTAIDTADFLISPQDKVYRILSREIDYESQAVVFFTRDYSGSMAGKATELVVAQHVLIYSWLLYQYARQVETRFVLHDTDATEVPDFYTYYNSAVAGGTRVASAYRLINQIVEKENLDKDYNIYIFHGTDGDDWDTDGKESIPELRKMLTYANRIGITIAEHGYSGSRESEVEKYLKTSGLLNEKPDYIRMDVIQEDTDEQRLIEGIKQLISE